jgi:hypothetical protein
MIASRNAACKSFFRGGGLQTIYELGLTTNEDREQQRKLVILNSGNPRHDSSNWI